MIPETMVERFKACVMAAQDGSSHLSDDSSWVERLGSFIEAIPPCKGPALVVGPGAGYECRLLQRRGYEVHAVDIEPKVTEHHIRMRGEGVHILNNVPMENMPYGPGEFGIVSSHHCLEHSLAPLAALCEWNRVLRVGGFLALGVPPVSTASAVALHICNFSRPLVAYLLAATGFDVRRGLQFSQDYDECFIVRKVADPLQTMQLRDLVPLLPEGMYREYPNGNCELADTFGGCG